MSALAVYANIIADATAMDDDEMFDKISPTVCLTPWCTRPYADSGWGNNQRLWRASIAEGALLASDAVAFLGRKTIQLSASYLPRRVPD